MSLFDTLARWLGLSEPVPAATSTDTVSIGAPLPSATAQSPISPYAELWQSVDRHLAQFMVHSVLPHRQFEPEDVFKLVRIQVTGTTPAAQNAIERFLAEFRPESRRKVVLAAVTRNCAQGVSTEGFVDFNRDFDRAELEESDPYDAQLVDAYQGGYQLTLYGEWELQRAVPVTTPPSAGAASRAAPLAVPLDLHIHDAAGRRQVQVATLPFVLGRAATSAEGHIVGAFVSRRHGLLERDEQGRIWYRETSVNGSILDDGAIAPGECRQLRNGAQLRLGGDASNAAECPVLIIRWAAPHDADAHTPIRAPLRAGTDGVTPIRTSLDDGAHPAPTPLSAAPARPLCVLAVKDAHGSRTVPVTRLPYVIGRSELADCRVPEDNAGVSRDHLVILAIDAAGARIDNNAVGKWGTEIDDAEQPAQFTLAWGRQVKLAGRFVKAPAVTVLLLPATA
ncbi:pSer/pThr/pTyr-binding forkhead associated (FHA) protein [Variovorax boronicumulans]|uniref:FHA domain-containing protein n=1 Tax=Variovorax boronicumulans TaxID=436515 RepID=UPI002783246E|nr:FHA domain-containing protein [Variovorax boronicumulans]MDP9912400.1 pSer/pThr/pTyr-binding forkhead associated (FHA) protein [Variovorax boronicumulans]